MWMCRGSCVYQPIDLLTNLAAHLFRGISIQLKGFAIVALRDETSSSRRREPRRKGEGLPEKRERAIWYCNGPVRVDPSSLHHRHSRLKASFHGSGRMMDFDGFTRLEYRKPWLCFATTTTMTETTAAGEEKFSRP
ncbi:hypothetical protein M0802_010876 [Mischocyttarus mexicanus]|nr:hypothetical protein M0802_010876 [Mischocyttarus mexicanus]